ncbi:hypothetical protein [Streptomyces sp. NPDC003697]
MTVYFHRDPDATTTGRDGATGFAPTHAGDEEAERRRLHEDAGREYGPPPPPARPGVHRFTLVHDDLDAGGFRDERYAALRARPPEGCVPADHDCFALECERPGRTLLDAVAGTVADIRREYGIVMNGLGIEKPDEWLDDDGGGCAAQTVAHLMLSAAHRAALLGHRRKDLVRLLDAAGVE